MTCSSNKRVSTHLAIAACFSLASVSVARSQHDPTTGVNRFPQFRNLSGLGGGGYGVDERGYASLSGPVALSSPVAYVLGRDQFRLGIAHLSFDAGPDFFRAVNGTEIITYGHTFGRVNVAATDMVLSRHIDQAFNLQLQYISSPGSRWTGSLGVQDVGGGGGSSGEYRPGDSRSSRSVFGVATYRWEISGRPFYLSMGGGTRRFRPGFFNASTQILPHVRLWAENDGFGVNAGGLVTTHAGRGRHTAELNLLYGMVRLRYAIAGFVIGF